MTPPIVIHAAGYGLPDSATRKRRLEKPCLHSQPGPSRYEVRLDAVELTLAIGNVRAFLEPKTDVTAEILGIDAKGTAWQ